MINLDVLKQLLTDRELQGQVARLVANKLRADVQSFEVSSLVSRLLIEAAGRAQRGESSSADLAISPLLKEYLDFYETLVNQTLLFNQRLKARLNHGEKSGAQRRIETLDLRGALNSTVKGSFRVENNRLDAITIGFEASIFRDEATGASVPARVLLDPPSVELKPGQESKIECIVFIEDMFAVHHSYLAKIKVKGMEESELWIRLQVERGADMAGAPPVPPREAPATSTRKRTHARKGATRRPGSTRRKRP